VDRERTGGSDERRRREPTTLADAAPTPGRVASGGAPVQCYRKHGAVRASDGQQLAVVDDGRHNRAYAALAQITAARAQLQAAGSLVDIEPGEPAQWIPGLAPGARQVLVRQHANFGVQRDGSIAIARRHRAEARAEMRSLWLRNLWRAARGDRRTDVQRALDDPQVVETLNRIYAELTDGNVARDFAPARVRRVAECHGLRSDVLYLLMEHAEGYHQRVLDEYADPRGMTTPNDCAETAQGFVRSGAIRRTEPGGAGYNFHAFSLVLHDGSDHVALENAVGGDRFAQLYKQAAFDADWHWQMRGAERPAGEAGDDEMRGLGVAVPLQTPHGRANARNARLDLLNDMLRRR